MSKCDRACDLFKNNIDDSKIIQNCYWGSLCKKKNAKNSINRDDNFIISDNHVITSFKSIDNKIILNLSNNDYARMSLFLFSQAH